MTTPCCRRRNDLKTNGNPTRERGNSKNGFLCLLYGFPEVLNTENFHGYARSSFAFSSSPVND